MTKNYRIALISATVWLVLFSGGCADGPTGAQNAPLDYFCISVHAPELGGSSVCQKGTPVYYVPEGSTGDVVVEAVNGLGSPRSVRIELPDTSPEGLEILPKSFELQIPGRVTLH